MGYEVWGMRYEVWGIGYGVWVIVDYTMVVFVLH